MFNLFKKNPNRRFKAKQSDLFKKISADARNNKELQKMIISVNLGDSKKGFFYVDNVLTELSFTGIPTR